MESEPQLALVEAAGAFTTGAVGVCTGAATTGGETGSIAAISATFGSGSVATFLTWACFTGTKPPPSCVEAALDCGMKIAKTDAIDTITSVRFIGVIRSVAVGDHLLLLKLQVQA
jgi:hypothetical protein